MKSRRDLRIALLGADTEPGLELYRALRLNTSDDILPFVQRRPAVRYGLKGWVLCDLSRPAELGSFLNGVDIVVHAAGPFSGAHQGVVDTAIEVGAHYFDLCDDRLYLRNIEGRDHVARERGVSVVCGLLPCPGISTVLASDLVRGWTAVKVVRIYLWPGALLLRSRAYFGALFDMVGSPIVRREWKSAVSVVGWGEPEEVGFLDPVGVVTVRNGDAPDLDISPRVLQSESTVFKVGVDSRALRWGLGCAARLRRNFRRTSLRSLRRATAASLRFFRVRRDAHTALHVVAEGERDGAAVSRSVSMVETQPGSGLALGAVLHAIERARTGGLGGVGVRDAAGWTTAPAMIGFLKERYGARFDWSP